MKDKNQEQVIYNTKDNIMLYAGAGTGKTYTIGKKIAYHLEKGLCNPSEILCLTFTVKASKEMAEDIQKSTVEGADKITVKTIHGFCYKIITEESIRLTDKVVFPQIIDEVDTEQILREKILPLLNIRAFSDQIRARGATHGVDWLKTRDVYYNKANKLFYFVTERAGKYFLINQYGASLTFDNGDFLNSPSGAICPECGGEQLSQGNFCEECGYDFRDILYPFNTKVANLRNFVSYIKRNRIIHGIVTLNCEQDYQNTFNYLYSVEQEKIDRLLCYKDSDYNKNIVDLNFLECLKKNCGYFINEYDKYLASTNCLDFDDLIIKTYLIFEDYERLKDYAKYSLVVVDEVQDTSLLEYSVLKKLFNAQVVLCGDLNQSIYKWRGAEPNEIIAHFKEEYNPIELSLETNYRSEKTLCNFADNFKKNAFSDKNKLKTVNNDNGYTPEVLVFDDFEEEARFVAKKAEQLGGSSVVLARTNAYAKNFYDITCKIPFAREKFVSPEEEISLHKNSSVKTFIALLRVFVNKEDKNSFNRVCREIIGIGAEKLKSFSLDILGVDSTSYLSKFVYEDKDCFEDLLGNNEIVVYDIETSSLDRDNCEIIQISALNLSTNQEFNKFIIPSGFLDKEAIKVHGYTEEFLKDNGENLTEVMKSFASFCKGKIIVGHNSNSFDLPIITRICQDLKIEFNFENNYDTLTLAKLLLSEVKNYKLQTICENLGVVNQRAHDAFSDVVATAEILKNFIVKLKTTQIIRKNVLRKNRANFEKFFEKYNLIKNEKNSLENLLNKICKDFKIVEKCKRGDITAERKIELVIEKIMVGNEQEPWQAIREYLQSVNEGTVSNFLYNANQIPVLTVHQSKGMEFDNVFLVGVDNFTFPDGTFESLDNEQRRIFYVAITRAKKRLFISYSAKNKFGRQNFPSKLLNLLN